MTGRRERACGGDGASWRICPHRGPQIRPRGERHQSSPPRQSCGARSFKLSACVRFSGECLVPDPRLLTPCSSYSALLGERAVGAESSPGSKLSGRRGACGSGAVRAEGQKGFALRAPKSIGGKPSFVIGFQVSLHFSCFWATRVA